MADLGYGGLHDGGEGGLIDSSWVSLSGGCGRLLTR